MGGQPVGGRRACARAAALGVYMTIGVAAAGILGLASAADALVRVSGTSVKLKWAAAAGPVRGYLVFVSRNGRAMRGEQAVTSLRTTVRGRPGETIRVRIAAWGTLDADAMGPLSPASEAIRFSKPSSSTPPPPPDDDAGDGGGDGDGHGDGDGAPGTPDDGLGLPDYARSELVRMERSWEVLDTGDFLGDGDDDVLFRFPGENGIFVLQLSRGRVVQTQLVTWKGVTAGRGPWRDDRDTLLVQTPDGNLAGWSFGHDGWGRRWGVRQSGLRASMAADLDGDRVEEVLRRFRDGSLRLPDGSSLSLPDLRSAQRVLVAEVNGDRHDDVVVADLARGRLDLWLEGRRRRTAPTLEANLDDVALARLQGSEPWLVGVDAGGRLRARPLRDATARTLGFVGRGARVHPADVDGDGRDELLVFHRDALDLWQPGS